MKKSLLALSICIASLTVSLAQTITCTPPSPICEGGSYSIGYNADFTPGVGNIFTVELSDELSSFASPTVIGTYASVSAIGSVSVTMPPTFVHGGIYFVRVNSSNIPVTGTDNYLPTIIPNADAGADQTICESSSAIMSTVANNFTSILWATSGSGTFSPNNATQNPTYTPSPGDIVSGNVTLTITVSNSNCPAADAVDGMLITIAPANNVNAGPDQTICDSQDVNLTGSTSASTIQWTTTGTGFFSNDVSLSTSYTPSAMDILNGSVNLTLTGSGGVCPAQNDNITVTIIPGPTVNAGIDMSLCGTPPAPFVTLGAGYTIAGGIQWTTITGGTFTNDLSTTSDYYPSGAEFSSGLAQLVIETTSNGICPAAKDTINIDLYNEPIIDAGPDQAICQGASVNLAGFVNSFPQVATLQWSTTGTGTFSSNTDPNASYAPSPADITAGNIKIIATAIHGPCTNYKDTMLLTFNPLPTVNFTAPASACAFNPVTFTDASTISSGSIVAYNWFFADDSSGGSSSSIDHSYNSAGVFAITLDVTSNLGCVSSGGWNIIITQGVDLSFNATPNDTVCMGETIILSAISSNADTYHWTTTNEFTPNIQFQPSTSGYYKIDVQNIACPRTDSVYIMVKNKPTAIFSTSDATCGNANGSASAIAFGSAPFTMLWAHNGSTSDNVTNLAADSYLFTVTDKSNCSENYYVNIGNTDGPTISSLSKTDASCQSNCNGSVNISVSGGVAPYQYQWNSLSTSTNVSSISSICAGAYTFSVKDANNCITNGAFNIATAGTDPLLQGKITLAGIGITTGTIDLMSSSSSSLAMPIITSTTVNTAGFYLFSDVPIGDYLISARADATTYPYAAKTYYVAADNWMAATAITATCNVANEKNISVINMSPMTGNDTIAGVIYNLETGKTNTIGDPIPGVDVSLEQNPGGIMIAQTTTDGDGKYQFDDVPAGNFVLFVDMPGVGMTSSHSITTGGGNMHSDNNFYVDSTLTIYATAPIITSVKNNSNISDVQAYPNPFKNKITLSLTSAKKTDAELVLYTLLGEKVMERTEPVFNETKIELNNLQHLPQGIYILKTKINNSEYNTRFVKAE